MALTDLEKYGATYELTESVYNALVTGMDNIRANSGWEDFNIPEKVWDLVSQDDRDDIINKIYQVLLVDYDDAWYSSHIYPDYVSAFDKYQVFALWYVVYLWSRWWLENSSRNSDEAGGQNQNRDVLISECGIPSGQTNSLGGIYYPWATVDWSHTKNYMGFAFYDSQYIPSTYIHITAYIAETFVPEEIVSGVDIHLKIDSSESCLFTNMETAVETSLALPDVDTVGGWTDYYYLGSVPDGFYLSDFSPLYSANITISEYGQADGSIELWEQKNQGDFVQLVQRIDSEDVNVMAGVISKIRKDLQTNRYRIEFSDLVSAKSNGEVEYSAGSPVAILQAIIEGYGGTFTTDITTTVMFYSSDEPVSWYDLCRSVCLALDARLVYNADGSYTLTRSPSSHSITSFFSGDETQETERYKNSITATVDEEFTTDVDPGDEPTVETETVMGMTVTITRKGEQVQSISIKDNITDVERLEEYTYNEDGYLTEKSVSEESDTLKQTRTEEFSDIADDNNYNFEVEESNEEYVLQCDYFGAGQTCDLAWVETSRLEISGEIHLDGISRVEQITKEIQSRADASWTLINKEKREYTIFQDNDGPITERIICEIFNWVRYLANAVTMTYQYHWVKIGVGSDPTNPILALELNPPIYQHSYHLSSTAKDENAIDTLGEIADSIQLIGITDEETLYQAALSELIKRSRVRILTLEGILNPDIKIGDLLMNYDGLNWIIEDAQHSIGNGRYRTAVNASQVSTVARLQTSLGLDPANYDLAVIKQIKKQGSLVHNVNRAKIVGRVDYETYQVQLPDKEAGKYVLAKTPYAVNEVLPVGAQVLLARPTGRGRKWEILWRSHESPISGISGSVQVTPDDDEGYIPSIENFIAADPKGPAPFPATLSWDLIDPELRVTKLEVDYGDDSETIDEIITDESVGTGDGETTIFTLGHTPKTGNEPVIYVDGVTQVLDTDYTRDGSNITFLAGHIPITDAPVTADYIWERTWGTGIEDLAKYKRSIIHTWETHGTYTVKIRAYYTDNDDVEQMTEWETLELMAGTLVEGEVFEIDSLSVSEPGTEIETALLDTTINGARAPIKLELTYNYTDHTTCGGSVDAISAYIYLISEETYPELGKFSLGVAYGVGVDPYFVAIRDVQKESGDSNNISCYFNASGDVSGVSVAKFKPAKNGDSATAQGSLFLSGNGTEDSELTSVEYINDEIQSLYKIQLELSLPETCLDSSGSASAVVTVYDYVYYPDETLEYEDF